MIHADEYNIKQAIGNIIDNALKYSSENRPISIKLIKNQGNVVCTVENYGDEISENQQKKIFEKFYRMDNSTVRKKEGTGIGLYISNEIVKAHGGHIDVSSLDGVNSFNITLPIDV